MSLPSDSAELDAIAGHWSGVGTVTGDSLGALDRVTGELRWSGRAREQFDTWWEHAREGLSLISGTTDAVATMLRVLADVLRAAERDVRRAQQLVAVAGTISPHAELRVSSEGARVLVVTGEGTALPEALWPQEARDAQALLARAVRLHSEALGAASSQCLSLIQQIDAAGRHPAVGAAGSSAGVSGQGGDGVAWPALMGPAAPRPAVEGQFELTVPPGWYGGDGRLAEALAALAALSPAQGLLLTIVAPPRDGRPQGHPDALGRPAIDVATARGARMIVLAATGVALPGAPG